MFKGLEDMSNRILLYEGVIRDVVRRFRVVKMNRIDRALVSEDEMYSVALTGVWRALRLADAGRWREPSGAVREKDCGFIAVCIRSELNDWLRFVGRRLNRQCVNLKFREGRFTDELGAFAPLLHPISGGVVPQVRIARV
jgi:hypothetical protein